MQRAPLHPLDQFRAFQAIPDTGIHHNLADKAQALGILVWRFGGKEA